MGSRSSLVRIAFGVVAVLFAVSIAAPQAAAGGTRNVILIIGDGMDDQQISIARNYLEGARGQLTLDSLPVRSAAHVLTVSNDDPDQVLYVADSANTATSMATGVVTSRGRLATTAGTDRDIETIIERAEAAGFATGIVATSSVTDATPASFAAHVNQRFCENPDQMVNIEFRGRRIGDCSQDLKANGGLGSISEQLAVSDVDVILGGGAKHFAPMAEGDDRTVHELAAANGYRVVSDKQALEAASPGGKLLGLFAPSHLPVKLRGEGGRTAEKPTPSFMNRIHRYLGSVRLPDPMVCEPNPAFADTPTLAGMTDVALAHLEAASERGFFLIIESASIDKRSHSRDPCGSIGELEQLDHTVARALAFAKRQPDTLILVTADHGHAAQIIPNESLFGRFGVPVYTPGHLARLRTPEGSVMAINYATNDFNLEEHSGVQVPVFANQPGVGRVPPMITQPQIHDIAANYLRIDEAPLASSDSP